ncbi:glycosyltransferase family 4 protein [Myxosarcina sp. GI1]|uniref:glycosyltransferase family 4 protein n=1 Tax=Myxosarcina sp. GI1 TaxID=1541065 RepID=UPI00055FB652|nr:glycosyltransferase family 4 protein [Myxosarcina sp. GI1]
MKTLQIGLGWFPECAGGLDRYYYDCCNYLPQANVEFDGLVVGSNTVESDSEGKVKAFATAEAPLLKRWLKLRSSFQQQITQHDYDLIVSHFSLFAFPVLNLLQNRPLVTHFHGPWALESDVETQKLIAIKVKKLVEQSVYKRSRQFIVLSKTFRDILHHQYGVPEEKIHIIPGGVDLNRFNIDISATEARDRLNWHLDRPTIFCIRRLARRMGLENLIAAIAKVRDRHRDVILYIAGKGVLATTLQQQISALELENNVKLLGYVSDEQLPLCYRAANFSVVPTLSLEGFGLIVVESLAAGTPVLGTAVGGIPEILQPFCNDLLFAGSSIAELAAGIDEALSGQRKLPSQNDCLAYVKNNYSWKTVARQIEQVYQQAL